MPRKELETFIIAKFEISKMKIEEIALSYLLDFTQSHPYYTQELCFHLWEMVKNNHAKINVESIMRTINKTLSIENSSYQNIFGLLTSGQKLALKALSKLARDEAPFSALFLKREGIATADSFRKALESLVHKSLIEKENGSYIIYDVFLKEWLRRQGK
jgi:DNA-binding SARP family transcriptional activator